MRTMGNMSHFWDERAHKHGHTGWADPLIYAYDQQARLMAIEEIVRSLNMPRQTALDFGTGSGEFAALLAKYFQRVLAYDISDVVLSIAKKRYSHLTPIRFMGSRGALGLKPESRVDMILSVTVLDCIMDDLEFSATLDTLRDLLEEDGIIVTLEYSPREARPKSYYQRFMTLDEWRSQFKRRGFVLQNSYGFFHPKEAPCDSYAVYQSLFSGLKGKILRRLIRIFQFTKFHHRGEFLNTWLRTRARHILEKTNDFYWEAEKKDSPVNIMIWGSNDGAAKGR